MTCYMLSIQVINVTAAVGHFSVCLLMNHGIVLCSESLEADCLPLMLAFVSWFSKLVLSEVT